MLAIKRSAGVAPELNLTNLFHAGKDAYKQRTDFESPKQRYRWSQKYHRSPQKIKKKKFKIISIIAAAEQSLTTYPAILSLFFVVDDFFFADTIIRHLDTFHHGYHSKYTEPSHLELFHPYLLLQQIGEGFYPNKCFGILVIYPLLQFF